MLSILNIKQYTIIDLQDTISSSTKYLANVLSKDQFKKVSFVSIDEIPMYKFIHYDLAINIDSFAEMDESVVLKYLQFINEKADYFYVKNPVGKYLDKSLDGHSQGNKIVKQALNNGILTNIVNIDDNKDINKNVPKFIKAYTPSKQWNHISNSWAKPFSYYWQALYKKENILYYNIVCGIK